MPLHNAIKDQGIENFSFEVIKTVEFIDDQHLLIIESCYMDKHDSICNGYNTKHSEDMFNLYQTFHHFDYPNIILFFIIIIV